MRLRVLLKRHGITQAKLAGEVGVSKNSVTEWIRGRSQPSVRHAMKMCEILDVTVEELFGEQRPAADPIVRRLADPELAGALEQLGATVPRMRELVAAAKQRIGSDA